MKGFSPLLRGWFSERFGEPTLVQAKAWPVLKAGGAALVAAPTGAGKTLAAFLPFIDALVAQAQQGELTDGVRVIYVSPLKALSNDITRNLAEPLSEINALLSAVATVPLLTVALRTGDSTPTERARIIKHPPHILVTTPESLYLMLTAERSRGILATATTVIIDEIHMLARDKRGAHLALSLERLEHLCGRPLQRVGLSATAKPLERIAEFLTGMRPCQIVDAAQSRHWDLKIETPDTDLGAICSYEMWDEVYRKLCELIKSHRSTLIFVNTRKLAERLAHQIGELMGDGVVMSHHGSMSKEHRLDAELRLKRGELKAVIATASLELGIDIGAIDLVCQVGSPRSIAGFVQRVGRSGHSLDRIPKGRIFALTRDELIESMALVRAVGQGLMDAVALADEPLDILAQHIVAAVSVEDWTEADLLALCRRSWPFRALTEPTFASVLKCLSEGLAPGVKRGVYLHHDHLGQTIKARRNARLSALTSGGAIPEQNLYRVLVEGEGTLVGTLDEDFAIETARGDIFQLGNTSWQVIGIRGSNLMVHDAGGAAPTIPFWRGEAPGRTFELSKEVSDLRADLSVAVDEPAKAKISAACGLDPRDAAQAFNYLAAQLAALGVIPTQQTVVWERFFDDSGGMQLVIHAPFGTRVNRAWGLALRKRFCRSFDFELQASADDDGIVLSVGPNQGFQLESLFKILKADTARNILVQATLDAPMFAVRWRWNVTRALAVLRFKGGKQVPPQLQRFQSGDLLTAAFPAQTQCFEHRTGDVDVPDHPLVQQTLKDCLTEAMDVDRWLSVLEGFEAGVINFVSRDSREPSPFCYERLNANPYAFLDDAPLEERRARAVSLRRVLNPDDVRELGQLDQARIAQVRREAWPLIRDAEELHDALNEMVLMTAEEVESLGPLVSKLISDGRVARVGEQGYYFCVQKWPIVRALYPTHGLKIVLPARLEQVVEAEDAIVAFVQGRLDVSGPITAEDIAQRFSLSEGFVTSALQVLESRGLAISGSFSGSSLTTEWCERRLLARIHRLTIDALREEIRPLPPLAYMRYLSRYLWVDPQTMLMGDDGVRSVLDRFAGMEIPAGAWESEIFTSRVRDYASPMLDRWLMTGEFVWGRLTPPEQEAGGTRFRSWSRDMPFAISPRASLGWLLGAERAEPLFEDGGPSARVYQSLSQGGALFFHDIVRLTKLLPAEVHEALGRMAHLGRVASDNLSGLRPYLGVDRKQAQGLQRDPRVRSSAFAAAAGGRWFLFPPTGEAVSAEDSLEAWAWLLLKRWGVLFSDLLAKERLAPPWRALLQVLRRLEARGQVRGGRFISGVAGEQYALPGVIAELRAAAAQPPSGAIIVLAACDPLNLFGLITSDVRIPATRGNRIVIRDGKLLAYRIGRRVVFEAELAADDREMVTRAIRLSGTFRQRDPFLKEWREAAGSGENSSSKERVTSLFKNWRVGGNVK